MDNLAVRPRLNAEGAKYPEATLFHLGGYVTVSFLGSQR